MSTQWVPIWVEDDKTASQAAELRELWSAETTTTGVKGHNKLLGRQRSKRGGAGRKRGGKGKKGGVKGKSEKSKCTGNKGGAQGKKGGGNQGGGQDMSGLGVAHVKCPKGSVGRDLFVRAFCKVAEQKQQQLSSKRNFSSNFSRSAQLFRKAVRSLREYVPAPPAAASSRTTSAARAPPHPPSRSCAERSDIIEL